MKELEDLWTAMEAEGPGYENFLEPILGEVAEKKEEGT